MKIIVWIEFRAGQVKAATLEALGSARLLADAASGEVVGVCCGSGAAEAAATVISAGAHRIISIDGESLSGAHADSLASELAAVATAESADLVLGAATSSGKEIMALAAGTLGTCVASSPSRMTATHFRSSVPSMREKRTTSRRWWHLLQSSPCVLITERRSSEMLPRWWFRMPPPVVL